MPEQGPINQKGYITPIVQNTDIPDIATSVIDPYALLSRNIKEALPKNAPLSFNTINASEIPINGRYPKYFPGENNEEIYGRIQPWTNKFNNDFKKMLGIAGTTFLSNTVGLVDGISEWASTGKFSSVWDNSTNNTLNDWTKSWEDSLPNYTTEKEKNADFLSRDNLLTPNFWFDKVMKNLGFSAGAIGGGLVWGAALKGIGLTGVLAKGGANMAELSTKMESALQSVPKAERSFAALKYLKDAAAPVLKTVGTAINTTDKANRILTAAFGTFGESSIEALNNSKEFKETAIREYKTEKGYEPTGADLDKINEASMHVGNWSMGLNTMLLTGTNYIQFPKILNMSSKAETSVLVKGAETQGLRQTAGGIVESTLPKLGFAKRVKQAENIAGLFFNPTEAFEEGAQNIIQVGSEDFFKKQYKGSDASILESLGYATTKTLTSKEGLENILIGGLSGALQTAKSSVQERGITGYGGNRQAATDAALSYLNDTDKSFGKSLKDNVDAYKRAQVIQEQKEAAVRQGDLLESKELERDYQFNYLLPRIKYGKSDFVLEDINRYKQQASTPTGFEELQREGYANDTDTQQSFLERLTNFEDHAKSVKQSYEYLTNKYGQNRNFTPEVFDRLTYNMSKIQNYDERIKQLSTDLLKKGIPVQDILNDLHKGSPKKEMVSEALESINNLNDVEPIKDDLKQQLQDVVELGLRRTEFKDSYNKIIKAPKEYQNLPIEELQSETAKIKQRNKEGKSISTEILIGKEYSIEAPTIFRDGNKLSYNPKLTIISKTLEGEYEVKLPDGTITYLKPTELKDYKLSETDNASTEMEEAVMKSIGSVLSSEKYKDLLPPFTTEENLQDKLNIINSLNNKVLIDAIQKEVKENTKELQKQLEEKKKKEEELRKNQVLRDEFFKTRKSLEQSNNEVITSEEPEDKKELSKVDISVIAQASTEPIFDSISEHNNAHRRHQEFLLNISTKPELQKLYREGKIKILPVTAKTEEKLGLKGIINPQFKDTSIRYVYVVDSSNGTLSYLDKDGNFIPAIKSTSKVNTSNVGEGNGGVDLNTIIFTNARETDLSYTDTKDGIRKPSYTNKPNLSQEELNEVETKWQAHRDVMLNADIIPENAIDNIYNFGISRGIPVVINTSTKNSLLDIRIIKEEDLVHSVITIPAIKGSLDKTLEIPINGSRLKANMPVGKPLFNYNGNMFYLNNRNFTKNEASNIAELLVQATNQLITDGRIEPKIKAYLESVIRFSNIPSKNAIYFDNDFNLFIGDLGKSIPATEVEKRKSDISILLEKEVYHHINKQKLDEFALNPSDTPYTELKYDNDKITDIEHKSYQHYLLLGKAPVLSTNIAIPQDGKLPIEQKYAIVDFDDVDVAKILSNRKVEPVPIVADTTGMSLLDQLNAKLSGLSKKESKVEDKPVANLLDTLNNALNGIGKKTKFGGGSFNEPQTRLANNPFHFVGDNMQELADVATMLPNVDIQYLTRLYEVTGGGQAWGYALPNLIALYEGRPFGVAYHEAFEQVFNWVLTAKEQLDLHKEFIGRQGSFKTYNGEYKTFKSATFKEAKEQMADEFAEFKATGRIPYPKKNTSNLFKRLWELIKSIFTNNIGIEAVFSKLSKGKYANSPILIQGNNEKQFSRKVENTPEVVFQDSINGFTAELFIKKWSDDVSLIEQLESNDEEATKPLFDKLYAGLEQFYTKEGDNTLDAYYSNLVAKNPSLESTYLREYEKVQQLWGNVKSQWGNYMNDLKSFLKTFDVAFTQDENGDVQFSSELAEEYEKLGGADSYISESRMNVNAKNSASKAVKLLFATVADSNWVVEETKNQLNQVTKKYTIGTNRQDNQLKLPNLAPYAKLFNYTLHNSANTNGIRNIYNNLRALALKHNIGINANLTRLLNRLGYSGSFTGMSEQSVKMVLKLENALSKNSPDFFRQYVHPKQGVINQSSNISNRTEQVIEEWTNAIKSSPFVVVDKDKIKFRSVLNKKELGDTNNFIFLSNLGIGFTKSDYDSMSETDKNTFDKEISFIKSDIKSYTTKYIPASGNFGFSNRFEKIAELYTRNVEGDSTESQHYNLGGEAYPNFILPNYISYLLNDLNNSKTRGEFIKLNPQYNDLYMGDSHLLNNVFFDKNGNRTTVKINTALTEGTYSSNGEVIAHDKMSYSSRLLNEINNNFNGISTLLVPADAKTPWGLNLGNQLKTSFFTDKEKALSSYMDIMWSALLNEVSLAKDYDNRKQIISLNQKIDKREVGKNLRFFRGVLSETLVNRINDKLIDSKEQLTPEQLSAFKTKFIEDFTNFINQQAQKTINNLSEYRLIEKDKFSPNFKIYGIDSKFLKKIGANTKTLKNDTIVDIFFYREANYILNNIELHKLFFNDPAQYKDEIKRTKSFGSGREYTHSDKESDLNNWMDINYNQSGDYQMVPGDWGYKTHKNEFNSITINKVTTLSEDDYGSDKYKQNEIADAQSWAIGTTFVEMLFKRGGSLDSKQKKLHQWLMAYDRQKGLVKGIIPNDRYPIALRNADNALLKTPIPNTQLQIIKPIISGVRLDNNNIANQFLYKTSTAPLYLYFVENTPMEDIYWDAIKNNVEFISMDSAHKVGQTTNNNIEWGSKFDKDALVPIDYKHFGIQVETGGVKSQGTQGSQLTKLATSGLISNGIPINDEAAKLIERHRNALINLTIERSNRLLNKLGIKDGQFGFTIDDKRKVAQFILDEITRRELPDNIANGIEVNEDNEFITPLEANVNYKKIKEILYSTIENNLLKPKVNGGPKILLSSLGYDNVNINGKEVVTNRKYKFYQEKGGKYTCQIGVPFMFNINILTQIEKSQGIKFENQKEGFKHVLDYLNTTEGGKDLLRGIGFRIPTQGLNSVDHFEIVEFLPPQMGDATIFPAEIVTKAGSDFDIDKMSLYLKNHYIDQNGYPKLVPGNKSSEELDEFVNKFEDKKSLIDALLFDDRASKDSAETYNFDKEQDYLNKLRIQSLENEYFSVLGDILSLKDTRDLLLKPNDASLLKNISEEVSPITEKVGDYTNFIDSDYMFRKRQLFLSMKSAVGIAAVSNTNLALNQFTDLVMSAKRFFKSDGSLANSDHVKRNFKLRFRNNSEDNTKINLSNLQNIKKQFISDLGSQIIDGTVDVAKSEWLPKMLGDADNLSTLLFMYKAGMDPYTAALFLNQPSIREFVKLRDISNNSSLFNPNVKKKFPGIIRNEMIKEVVKFTKDMKVFFSTKPDIYSNKELEQNLFTPYSALNKQEKYLQLQMLDDFFMIKQLAGDLFTVVSGYNYDTSNFQNPDVVVQKQLDLQKALELDNVVGMNDLLTKTHLGVIVKNVINTSSGINTLFSLEKGEAKNILNKFRLNIRTQFFKRDDILKFSEMGAQSMTDFIINTEAQIEGIPIEDISKNEFFGKNTVADWVKAMQLKPSLLKNSILQNLEAVIDKRDGYNSYIKLVEKDFDTFTSNKWTSELKELKDSAEIIELDGKTRTVNNIFKHLLISQFLQNGVGRSKNSFLHLIPTKEFSNIVSPVLSNIKADLDLWLREGLFYRNNYNDRQLFEEVKKEFTITKDENSGMDVESYELPTLNSTLVKQTLEKAGYSSNILILDSFGNLNKQFVKSTKYEYDDAGNITDKIITIYKRVEKSPNEVVTLNLDRQTKIVFKEVNKLGNDNLKEYYSNRVQSLLSSNNPFNEVSDRELYNILSDAKLKPGVEIVTNLVSPDEYDVSLEDEISNNTVNLKPGKC